MDEAAVKALIDKAIGELKAEFAAVAPPSVEAVVEHVWTKVRQGVVKVSKVTGVSVLAITALAGAVYLGHVL